MGVYLKITKSGDFRPHFYGSYTLNGKRVETSLNEWKGTPPANGKASDCLKGDGDPIFQESYFEAKAKLEQHKKKYSETPTETEKSRLIEQRNELNERIFNLDNPVTLGSLWNDYKEKVGSFSCTPGTVKTYETYTNRFAHFVSERHSEGLSLPLFSVNYSDILAFMQMIEKEGNKNRTWNEYLRLVKRIFRTFYPSIEVTMKLSNLKTRTENNTPHKIFTKEQIDKITETAKKLAQKDPSFSLIYSMIIIAYCTGLRLKDIRNLKWEYINFNTEIIALTTFKNDGFANFGMWTPLKAELKRLRQTSDASAVYVLPEAIIRSDTYLLKQLKRVLSMTRLISPPKGLSLPKVIEPSQELFEAVSEAINNSKLSGKRKQKALRIISEYILNGCTVDDIALKLETSKGSVSGYLTEATRLSGKEIIRGRVLLSETVEKKDTPSDTETKKEIIGWHSFRGSFVTMALKVGYTVEFLKKILGSSFVEIILKHYYRPDDDYIRHEFSTKDPFKE